MISRLGNGRWAAYQINKNKKKNQDDDPLRPWTLHSIKYNSPNRFRQRHSSHSSFSLRKMEKTGPKNRRKKQIRVLLTSQFWRDRHVRLTESYLFHHCTVRCYLAKAIHTESRSRCIFFTMVQYPAVWFMTDTVHMFQHLCDLVHQWCVRSVGHDVVCSHEHEQPSQVYPMFSSSSSNNVTTSMSQTLCRFFYVGRSSSNNNNNIIVVVRTPATMRRMKMIQTDGASENRDVEKHERRNTWKIIYCC